MIISKKHYALAKAPGTSNELVCFSLDSTRPDEYMEAVERDLVRKRFQGVVVLDLLACNGDSRRRFMRLNFDGSRLDWMCAKVAPKESLGAAVIDFCQRYYQLNSNALGESVLTKAGQHHFLSRHFG
jgi:hypothetical protein